MRIPRHQRKFADRIERMLGYRSLRVLALDGRGRWHRIVRFEGFSLDSRSGVVVRSEHGISFSAQAVCFQDSILQTRRNRSWRHSR